MQGDFSRDSFDPLHRFTRVLQQQGRVQLDADANEGGAIGLYLLRALAADLIGPYGGSATGFAIGAAQANGNFTIGPGRYYVDGLLCENAATVIYSVDDKLGVLQPYLPTPPEPLPPQPPVEQAGGYLVYLDVWERHVASAQLDGLREIALGGPDTASRAQLVWQVKLLKNAFTTAAAAPAKNPTGAPKGTAPKAGAAPSVDDLRASAEQALADLRAPSGMLIARAADPTKPDDSTPCLISPQARYRGFENQLYRVEIRRGGTAQGPATAEAQPGASVATFVWSRENASVIFAVADIAGERVRLAAGWHDARFGLNVGDFVEISDDVAELTGRVDDLRRVVAWDADSLTVTLDATPFITTDDPARRVILRLWNHVARPGDPNAAPLADDNALLLVEGRPLPLEDGITVEFPGGTANSPARYRTGDYWLIPARTASADIIWPRDATGAALPRPPAGIVHHYAPLAGFPDATGAATDLRRIIQPLAK